MLNQSHKGKEETLMAKKQVQFKQGLSLPGFLSQFGTEDTADKR